MLIFLRCFCREQDMQNMLNYEIIIQPFLIFLSSRIYYIKSCASRKVLVLNYYVYG